MIAHDQGEGNTPAPDDAPSGPPPGGTPVTPAEITRELSRLGLRLDLARVPDAPGMVRVSDDWGVPLDVPASSLLDALRRIPWPVEAGNSFWGGRHEYGGGGLWLMLAGRWREADALLLRERKRREALAESEAHARRKWASLGRMGRRIADVAKSETLAAVDEKLDVVLDQVASALAGQGVGRA